MGGVMLSTGRVIRFDEFKGYGFVAPDEGGEDEDADLDEAGCCCCNCCCTSVAADRWMLLFYCPL